jgi:hypothetical protein
VWRVGHAVLRRARAQHARAALREESVLLGGRAAFAGVRACLRGDAARVCVGGLEPVDQRRALLLARGGLVRFLTPQCVCTLRTVGASGGLLLGEGAGRLVLALLVERDQGRVLGAILGDPSLGSRNVKVVDKVEG